MAAISNTKIVFPPTEWKAQSPYLYLQSVGSTRADGSTYGAHVRWMLLRNLGDTHLPKGDNAGSTLNFNRANDYMQLYRSRYNTRFPTIVDFSTAPNVVNDGMAFWIYTTTNTSTVVYIHFRDAARYASVRSSYNPATQPLQFVEHYAPGLMEAEVKDKLFFAAEFDVVRNSGTVLRAEALSVESNVPLSPLFVSCRKLFNARTWCKPGVLARTMGAASEEEDASRLSTGPDAPSARQEAPEQDAMIAMALPPTSTPSCCEGNNYIYDNGFENSTQQLQHGTDYTFNRTPRPGVVYVTSDASKVNGKWVGLPHSGSVFLTVDGSQKRDQAVLRYSYDVQRETTYCFGGWVSRLLRHSTPITLEFRFTGYDGTVQSFYHTIPADTGVWEEFSFQWYSGAAYAVKIEIFTTSTIETGNDFGLDDLWFCRSKEQGDTCRPRIVSENIRSVRFDVQGGYPRRLELETYQDYIAGALWNNLGGHALTDDDAVAFNRLEPSSGLVNGRWQKFNDNALLRVANYQDRWTRSGGLREGVQRYISLSDTDPMALDTLPGDSPDDGAFQTSMLDMLRMVSLDFHVARMFGLGYLDTSLTNDTDEYIYLGLYDTDGKLDDTNAARPVRHYYMGVPTSPLDYRLPDLPELRPVTYGLSVDNGGSSPTYLTDPQGYTPDGLSRYINLFVEPEDDGAALGPFFDPPDLFCATDKTSSAFYGIEYRKQGESAWRKPEIAHDAEYRDLDSPDRPETLPLPNNADPARPILQHVERENGVHEYAGYGINWFSRVSAVGNIVATDTTVIKKANRLLPPSNLAVQLVQSESPLILTTSAEQAMLAAIPGADKTLVRVTFDYYHTHDANYDFADKVQFVFRSSMPRNVVGAIKMVYDDPADSRRAILRTEDYMVNSLGTVISPSLSPSLYGNFIGGVVSCQQKNYIIVSVGAPPMAGEGPVFTVKKIMQGNASDPGSTGTFVTVQDYTAPELDPLSAAQVMFMAVENMADIASWGTPNPLSKTVTIGNGSWGTHTETYVQDGESISVNLRGIWESATATHTPVAAEPGLYRINFQTFQLPNHPQSGDADPVNWYKGVVRIARNGDPGGPKKVLEVIAMENLGAGLPLVLHAVDNSYDPLEPIITGTPVTVNYYPGYRVYLHADPAKNFTASQILPAAGEGSRKTWLGARSADTSQPYYSAVGVPGPIVAMEFIEPLPPEEPNGSEYATRPDFYYKSSYTFRMNFAHKPFAMAMYRANEEAILRAIYSDATYKLVRAELDALGEDDPYFSDRWRNLISFDYVYDTPGHPYYDPTGSNPNGRFRKFPRESGYAFPNPDKGGDLNGGAPGGMLNALREAVTGAFTSLVEMPMMYDYIKGPSYVPVPKPQKIRNSQGTLLPPTDPEFDMAPMAKKTGSGYEVQFTDFTLDGSGNNIFFYYGREIGNRGRLGDPGPIGGPIRLINSRPPDSPGVKKVYVQEASALDATGPFVNFEINSYPEVQKVDRMQIYRATDATAALTVRTMDLVKTVDFADASQAGGLSLLLSDDFEDGIVPYGDPLFYRIIALRRIKDSDGNTDWAPSQPSKLLLTTVIDTVNPEAPEIGFVAGGLSGSPVVLNGVFLSWPVTTYNGTYYLEKMNSAGNWVTIYRVKTNSDVSVDLADTDLGTNTLPKEDPDTGWPVYNRFRVRVENSSGLFNLEDRVLTI